MRLGLKTIGLLVVLCALATSAQSQSLNEGFEMTGWPWSPWVSVAGGGTIVTTPVHSGSQALRDMGWYYRTDVSFGNAGDKYEGWANPAGSGRYYMGFAASSAGCFSLVLAPNTSTLIIQQNSAFNYSDVASVPFTYALNQWYKVEVEFVSTTSVIGRLYDSSGATVLATVNYTSATSLVGGAAMRAFGTTTVDDIKTITGPMLSVSANAGTAQSVFSDETGPGGNGLEAGSFTIASNGQTPGCVLTSIDITASGTGNDATAFTEIRLYRDTNASDQFEFGVDSEVTVAAENFTADDGTINVIVATAEQAFAPSETRTYFVVGKLAGTALPGETFSFTVSDINVVSPGLKSVPANSTMAGLVIDTPQFAFADVSPSQPETVFLTFSGVCQVFTVTYPLGPADKPASISVSTLGTADESTDLVNTQLWWDSDNDGQFNNTADTLVDTQVLTQDNGVATFSLASHPDFQASDSRRYFVVHLLNANAGDQETLKSFVSSMGPASLGGLASGLPTPSANGTPGLEVSAAILFGIMYGPTAPLTVDSNASNVLLADVGMDALPGGDWGIDTVTFNAGGTGSHNSAYAELALYEDTNNNGTWDGAGTDTLAAPIASGFVANSVSFNLTLTTLLGGDERRFFLVAAFNGTAAAGETFGARLTSFVPGITPPGGSEIGFPTPASTAAVIDVPMLSVANSPIQPAPATHAAGTAGELVGAAFRLNALNGGTTVNGITFTTSGTGDWSSDVEATTGVGVYRDNGDGVYSATDDTLLDEAGGASPIVTTSFSLGLATGEIADLWVVIRLTATAGQGIAATPETFIVTINAPSTDVSATIPATTGMPAPAGVAVGAIEFSVTNFDPSTALQSGAQPLTIMGSGFMAPFSVVIGGTECFGTPVIAGGTQVTGLTIPPGVGQNLPIVVHSGNLPPQTLTQTFTYTAPKDNEPPKADESGCTTGGSPQWSLLVAALGLLAGVIVLRRRAA